MKKFPMINQTLIFLTEYLELHPWTVNFQILREHKVISRHNKVRS